MQIGFLACPETLPHAGADRRGDAFEHDLQVNALRPALTAIGAALTEIDWHSPVEDFAKMDLVLLGTAWDYQDQPHAFLAKLEALEAASITVCNPPSLVRWNMDKRYLQEVEARGVRTIPTMWSDNPDSMTVNAAFDHFGCEKVVVKRQIGAGGLGQHLFAKDAPPSADWSMGMPAMLQPFLPAIKEEGELSFVFIDGAFSHAIQKTPSGEEYRIQSLFGGKEKAIQPSDADIGAAGDVLAAMPGDTPLYARIDMLRADDGALMVMEAEAIEPFLYPVQGPELGLRIAAGIARRLS